MVPDVAATIDIQTGHPVPAGPVNEYGEPYAYALLHDGGSAVTYADTFTELVEQLIDGYDQIAWDNTADADMARGLYLQAVRTRAQARILGSAARGTYTYDEQAAMTEVIPAPGPVWTCPVPIVLVDAFYEPFTRRPRPESEPRDGSTPGTNIIWLSWADEKSFIESLHNVGEVVLYHSNSPTFA
jgi:hypothetical protein